MIAGIGTDLVEIARVQKAIGRPAFLEKVYTEKERKLIAARKVRAAGNFAAKEAVAKALGCGFAGIAPAEIEILREASGMPYVVLHGRAKKKAEEQRVCKIQISLTDTEMYAQAYAVCETADVGAPDGKNSVRESSGKISGEISSIEETMRPVLDAMGMKEADRITIEEIGIPSLVLMERAALAVADCVKKYGTSGSRIGVLCGTGNNGGDGVAVARLLTEAGYAADVLLIDAEKYREAFLDCEEAYGEKSQEKIRQKRAEIQKNGTTEFWQQLKTAMAYGVPVYEPKDTKRYDIIVDALFGIGLTRKVEGEYAALLERLNKELHTVIAVDIASGISASDGTVCGVALRADETITFGAVKCGQLLYPGKEYTGKLTVADIGFPKEVLRKQRHGTVLMQEKIEALLPERPSDSNKGTFGKVAVVAGSKDMAGAAYFAACAAYRMGAGLVRIVSPECNREILQTLLPEAMLTTYTEQTDFLELAKETVAFADALVIGPGLGQSTTAETLVDVFKDSLCRTKEAPASVWDADALNLMAKKMQEAGLEDTESRIAFLDAFLPEHAVLTPHPGELARLLGKTVTDVKGTFLETAKQIGSVGNLTYVLKDAVTLTVKKKECVFNTTGNNGMASGGSGDILCGVIAALLAAGKDCFSAAATGVWIHGAAGDAAKQKAGATSMIARDILQAIGELVAEKRIEEVK